MSMNFRIVLLIIAMSVPSLAFAQLYRCKLTDGSVSFQERPCPTASASTKVTLPRATIPYVEPENVSTENAPRKREFKPKVLVPSEPSNGSSEYQRRLEVERMKAENDKMVAHYQMQRCNFARQQLGVIKTQRPVYSYNDKGDRVYIEDKDRAAQVASAERRVAEECK
jgi:hypothetical protein